MVTNHTRGAMAEYEAADQQIAQDGNLVHLLVTVGADPPDGDFHIRLLAPVRQQPGEIVWVSVRWRGLEVSKT